jgi:carboxymethylenebutenolidase|tara:strand:- start:2476 stop:3147 length:672 start_codon:yes stop_codon:yes gene_type:complete
VNDSLNYNIEEIDIDGSVMEVFMFPPAGDGPSPALILAQHIPVGHTGLENDIFTLVTAQRFANAGFHVAVPFIFHWWPKDGDMMEKANASRDELTLKDLNATFELLTRRADVLRSKIAIVGHCWGGRVAWLGACHIQKLAACAIFYGGRIKRAMGNDDQNPSVGDVNDYEAALTQANVTHTFYRYDNVGHAFQNFPSPERYNPRASEDAWSKVVLFLKKVLNN